MNFSYSIYKAIMYRLVIKMRPSCANVNFKYMYSKYVGGATIAMYENRHVNIPMAVCDKSKAKDCNDDCSSVMCCICRHDEGTKHIDVPRNYDNTSHPYELHHLPHFITIKFLWRKVYIEMVCKHI